MNVLYIILNISGRSLIYVAILGVIFLYVYALIGFALFRPVFDPNGGNELYCATLWQCSVTLIRYGLVGIDEVRTTVVHTYIYIYKKNLDKYLN